MRSSAKKSTKLKPGLRSIKPTVDATLVDALERWLESAKRGELTGAILLGNERGTDVSYSDVGHMPTSRALLAFEYWKLSRFGVTRD